jgi:hypothetical protein
MMNENDNTVRPFATLLPSKLIERIKTEACRQGIPMTRLLAETLDEAIPRAHIIVADDSASVPCRAPRQIDDLT